MTPERYEQIKDALLAAVARMAAQNDTLRQMLIAELEYLEELNS